MSFLFGIATTVITGQDAKPTTFEMTVSLPSPTLHVGDRLEIQVVTKNRTNHVVYAGSGLGGGLIVELINEKGEDIGVHAMGGVSQRPAIFLHTGREGLQSGGSWTLTWYFHPESGYLVSGTYKLRVHRRDVGSSIEVYSNAVNLTVIP
jgi:hypothetical protein